MGTILQRELKKINYYITWYTKDIFYSLYEYTRLVPKHQSAL